MQFPADDEDADFLVPGASRARLSSLFENDTRPADVNQALTFTAPKQPKKNDNAQEALKLIYAAAVNAFKLKDGSYSSQGKLGCAILGLHETHYYKILLYKGKQVPVAVVTVTPNFIFHVQPHNYANFYDEKKENWSINFDSEATLVEFVKQVALARTNAQGQGPQSLVIQDLHQGEGPSVENGDAVEIKYSGWLLSNFAFGSMFDSNTNAESSFRFRLGKSKVIKGWHEGLLGIKKGGKRLLVVPPDLAYDSEGMSNVVPPNSTLIFEVHAVKVKTSRDVSHSPSPVRAPETIQEKKPEVPQKPPFIQDENIKQRGASISEHFSQSPKKDKAQLISRMAKMGTATLPFPGAIAAHVSSDSEPEVDHSLPSSQGASRTASPKLLEKPRSRRNSERSLPASPHVVASQAVHPLQGSMSFSHPSQVPIYDGTVMPTQASNAYTVTPYQAFPNQLPSQYSMLQSSFSMQNVPNMVPTSMVDTHLPMLINETRNQNMEVRLSLSKLTDKVDSILTKVDDLQLKGKSSSSNVPFMEGNVLMQNIQRIIEENTRLTSDIETKNAKIELLNEKICDLFQRNQRFFEESSSMLEKKNDSLENVSMLSQEKILSLEQEKIKLQLELSSASMKLNALEGNLSISQDKLKEIQQQLEVAESASKSQSDALKEKDKTIDELQAEVSCFKSAAENLKILEAEKSSLLAKIEGLENAQNNSQETNSLIKMYKEEIDQYKGVSDKLKVTSLEKSKLEEENRVLHKEIEQKITESKEIGAKYMETVKKYENLQAKSLALKDRYELVAKELRSLKSTQATPDFSTDIKKVMNILYKTLQSKFESDTSYIGSQVLDLVLQTIMSLTFQVLERKNKPVTDQSSLLESPKSGNASKSENDKNGIDDLKSAESSPDSSAISSQVVNEETSESEVISSKPQSEEEHSVSKTDDISHGPDAANEETVAEVSNPESSSEHTVNNNYSEETIASDESSNTKAVSEAKRESPEKNLQSDVFSEQTSGSLGSKV